MFSSTHQMKFVVNPPSSTTIRTGRPCHEVGVPCCISNLLDGIAGVDAEGQRRAHHAGERGHQQPLHEVELLDRGLLLLLGHLAFLRHAGHAGNGDAGQANATPARITSPDRVSSNLAANSRW